MFSIIRRAMTKVHIPNLDERLSKDKFSIILRSTKEKNALNIEKFILEVQISRQLQPPWQVPQYPTI